MTQAAAATPVALSGRETGPTLHAVPDPPGAAAATATTPRPELPPYDLTAALANVERMFTALDGLPPVAA